MQDSEYERLLRERNRLRARVADLEVQVESRRRSNNNNSSSSKKEWLGLVFLEVEIICNKMLS